MGREHVPDTPSHPSIPSGILPDPPCRLYAGGGAVLPPYPLDDHYCPTGVEEGLPRRVLRQGFPVGKTVRCWRALDHAELADEIKSELDGLLTSSLVVVNQTAHVRTATGLQRDGTSRRDPRLVGVEQDQ